MADMKKELTFEEMGKVSGGIVVVDDANKKYWVVGNDGSIIGPAPTKEQAISFSKAFDISQEVITLEDYKKRFGHDLVW